MQCCCRSGYVQPMEVILDICLSSGYGSNYFNYGMKVAPIFANQKF